MLVSKCEPMFPFKNSSKDAKFGQCLHLWVPSVLSRTDVKKGLKPIFNVVMLTKSAVSRLVRECTRLSQALAQS